MRRALRNSPRDARFLKDLGAILAENLKDFQEAVVVYKRLLACASDSMTRIEAAVALGDLFRREGAVEEAVKWYEEAAAAGTVPPDVHRLRGELWERLGERKKAAAAYKKYLESVPDPGKKKEIEKKLKELREGPENGEADNSSN